MSLLVAVFTVRGSLMTISASTSTTSSSTSLFASLAILMVDLEVSLLLAKGRMVNLLTLAAKSCFGVIRWRSLCQRRVLHEIEPVVPEEFVGELEDTDLPVLGGEFVFAIEIHKVIPVVLVNPF